MADRHAAIFPSHDRRRNRNEDMFSSGNMINIIVKMSDAYSKERERDEDRRQ